jgi:hypothetical protein
MTDDEKRKQKMNLLMEHEEARQELEQLRIKAWTISQQLGEVAQLINESREMGSFSEMRLLEAGKKISQNADTYKKAMNFEAVMALRGELAVANAKFKELTAQKKALGLGA